MPAFTDATLSDTPIAEIAAVVESLSRCAHLSESLGEIRLDRLVFRLLDLDESEAQHLDLLAGNAESSLSRSPAGFYVVLQRAIQELRLHRLFTRTHDGEFHRSVCPAAYNEQTGEHYPEEMATWRADFRAMAPERQMMAATIVWLYQSGPDSTWLRRVPCTWRATEALHSMQDAGCLSQWLRLIASYPGW
ncbi:MAG: hypothetical protein JSS14_01805 [Proteobacteria bacterium]|nr:hypothetical protein [Pseudomonadota bacterium]